MRDDHEVVVREGGASGLTRAKELGKRIARWYLIHLLFFGILGPLVGAAVLTISPLSPPFRSERLGFSQYEYSRVSRPLFDRLHEMHDGTKLRR